MELVATDLAFGYPGVPVGRAVSLSVRAGRLTCLLGPNGCGKTTLFKTLLGLLPHQGGSVALDGQELARLPRSTVARAIAYVPQGHTAVFPYSVLDMVLMGRTAHGGPFARPRPRDRQRALEALERLGISALAEHDYTRISGGQRQLVLIARALAQESPLLIMDEPTANLDFGNQVRVLEQVRALTTGGLGIVLSTHDPDQAFACATDVLVLHEGTTLAQGIPEAVVTEPLLRTVYGVEVSIERLASGRRVCSPSFRTPPPS